MDWQGPDKESGSGISSDIDSVSTMIFEFLAFQNYKKSIYNLPSLQHILVEQTD